MEARTILLTSLVFALWTSTTSGQTFCSNLADGSYCQHCLQPVDCANGTYIAYPLCATGTACTVAFGASYCAPHTQTACACAGTGPQCDAYNPGFIEHCGTSGPFRVDPCPASAPTCYNDECAAYPQCNHNAWNTSPDCTGAYFCDENGIIIDEVYCEDGEYVNSGFECVPGPPAACDGSCTGRCPNPVDCTKYLVCDGTTVVSSGSCPPNSHFDIVLNTCINAEYICTFLDGCDLEMGISTPGTGSTASSPGISTPSSSTPTTTPSSSTPTTTTTTTTDGSIVSSPAPETCNSSTVNSKLPYDTCSQMYWVCKEQVNGLYEYVSFTCPGDLYFDTDASNPYCTDQTAITTCQ